MRNETNVVFILGMLLVEKKVYVGRFIPRKEREKELGEKAKLYTNVYVKNFGDELIDESLYEMFKPFGTITSHRVMTKDTKSRGFGFVAFEKLPPPEITDQIPVPISGVVADKFALFAQIF